MKVNITVDCTPEEARTFLGLPDISPLQDEMMNKMREQMESAAMNPEETMKTIFPAGTEGLAEMQKMFWPALSGGAAGRPPAKK
jgi:hypothetical protein